jgi:hypothetical protein
VETVNASENVSALDAGAEMSLNRYSARRDRNEKQIVDGLRAIGAKVLRIPNPDLLVLFNGQLFLIEIKTRTGRPTRSQLDLSEQGWPIHVARSLPAALRVIMKTSTDDDDILAKRLDRLADQIGDGMKRLIKDLE